MNKTYFLCLLFTLAFAMSSCAGEFSQQIVATSTVQPEPGPNPDPEPDPVPDPGGAEYPTIIPTDSAKIPVTWASLNLSGKLIYSLGGLDKNNNYIVQIQMLDLLTGNMSVLH